MHERPSNSPPPRAPAPTPIEFARGQPVFWPAAPAGIAQVAELRRTHVRLYYRCRSGRGRQPLVRAQDLAALQVRPHVDLPLPLANPYGRAVRPGRKEFA